MLDENATIELHGELLTFGEVVRYMDPAIFERAASKTPPWCEIGRLGPSREQRVLDAYLEMHQARYGEEFVRGELASLW